MTLWVYQNKFQTNQRNTTCVEAKKGALAGLDFLTLLLAGAVYQFQQFDRRQQ